MRSAPHVAGQAAYKLIIVLALLCVVFAALAGRLWLRSRDTPAQAPRAAQDATQLVNNLVAAGNGLWDNHPDADVGRLLQPGLRERDDNGIKISSNAFGMREHEYVLPKPAGTVRVVLLGDSFVYGMGVGPEQRAGVQLQRLLRERCGTAPVPPIEVLHLGVTSWNAVAECAYVRRQLSLLQPDLVVQVLVPNDLDDTVGVRGMGLVARSVPRRPAQADTMVSMTFGRWALDPQSKVLLPWAMDGESRQRLDEAAEDIAHLAQALTATGGRYLLLLYWQAFAPVAQEAIASRLAPDQICYLPASFYHDERYRISAQDEHWNPAGHEQVARFLYGLIVDRKLLPALSPAPWEEAQALSRELDAAGRREAQRADALASLRAAVKPAPAVDFAQLTPLTAGQVYGGVTPDGLVGPYASMIVAREGGNTLHLVGQCLPRPELDGAHVDIFVDADKVAQLALSADAPIDLRATLPAAALAHDAVAVRLQASDYVYAGADLRQCVTFRLQRVAIEP